MRQIFIIDKYQKYETNIYHQNIKKKNMGHIFINDACCTGQNTGVLFT
jgi:hypothetical protein